MRRRDPDNPRARHQRAPVLDTQAVWAAAAGTSLSALADQVAADYGLSPWTVRHWVYGRAQPSLGGAAALAAVLGVPLESLVAWPTWRP